MKKKFLTLIIVFISFIVDLSSQSHYENGYLILNDNSKLECLILNKDWLDNPTTVTYKIKDKKQTDSIKSIKEFCINGKSKYIRFHGDIERSDNNLSNLTTQRNPKFNNEIIYLRVLLEGPGSLYEYINNGITKYFIKTPNNNIQQLIKIEYLSNDGGVKTNNMFRQQLSNHLICESIHQKDLKWLDYNDHSLSKIFKKYNNCIEPQSQLSDEAIKNTNFIDVKKKRSKTRFTVTAGPTFNKLEVLTDDQYYIGQTELEVGYRIGIEAEFTIPYFHNQFSLLLEPVFYSFSYNGTFPPNPDYFYRFSATNTFKGSYSNIDINVGIRYKYVFNKNTTVFTNLILSNSLPQDAEKPGVILNDSVSSYLTYHDSFLSYYSLGLGYKLNDKFSLEARLSRKRRIVYNYAISGADLSSSSLIFGYTF